MSYFAARDPAVGELIQYLIARALDRDATLTKTKLVKLLYLIDVETWRAHHELLTGLAWRFYHYGPYAFALEETLSALEGHLIAVKEFTPEHLERTVLYTSALEPPSGDSWRSTTKSRVDKILDQWADESLPLLLDYVYFETEPMREARRGDVLDFTSVASREIERPPPSARINREVQAQLRELLDRQAQASEALEIKTEPRYDDVWQEAMDIERARDGEPPDLSGATLYLTNEAIESFSTAADG